jgi:hypothetical protein
MAKLSKLSPIDFDPKRIAMWARAHLDEAELNVEKIA